MFREPVLMDVCDKTHGHFIVVVYAKWDGVILAKWKVNNFLTERGMITLDEETVVVSEVQDEQTFLFGPSDHSFTVIL